MKRKNWRKISYRAVDCLGGFMFFIMIFFTGINVFTGWLVGRRYSQLEEIVLSAFVWVTYMSLGHHYRDKQCVSVDFVLEHLPGKWRKAVEVIDDIAAFVLGAVILVFAWQLMLRSTTKYTSILKIQFCWIDLGVVFGFFSLLVNIVGKYLPEGSGESTQTTAEKELSEQ